MSEHDARDGLDGFGPAARRAIEAAADAALELGTVRVGTEHLLLGVLAVGSSAAAELLRSAGAGRSAVRRKVGETNVGGGSPAIPGAVVRRSPRADRALSRAHRFAHDRRSPEARSEHLLLGILDVEGTAGQVLRGLDVDVDALRARLQRADLEAADGVESADPPPRPPSPAGVTPRCPACGSAVMEAGVSSTVVAAGEARVRLVSCAGCGTVLGTTPA